MHYDEQREEEALKQKKYKIIYADPPWHYGSKSAVNNTSGSDHKPLSDHYSTMPLEQLKLLPISEIKRKTRLVLCGSLILT